MTNSKTNSAPRFSSKASLCWDEGGAWKNEMYEARKHSAEELVKLMGIKK